MRRREPMVSVRTSAREPGPGRLRPDQVAAAKRHLEVRVDRVLDLQSRAASHDPKYLEATSKAINGAVLAPASDPVETRISYNNLGELAMAVGTVAELLESIPTDGATRGLSLPHLVKRVDDEHAVAVTFELSNGSAIRLGVKGDPTALMMAAAMGIA